MRVAAHIPFFFVESRIIYLKQVIDHLQRLSADVDIFVYTNNRFIQAHFNQSNVFIQYYPYSKYGKVAYFNGLWNRLSLTSLVHPFYLTWENRKVIEKNLYTYEAQLYLEDDICFTAENFNYWLANKDACYQNDFNLAFLRFEESPQRAKYLTDLTSIPEKIIEINNRFYLLNDINPYGGFWIYDKNELIRFSQSQEWKFNFDGFPIREKSAIGHHSLKMKRFKGNVIPLVNYDAATGLAELPTSCLVHHLPNTYIGHSLFCKIKVETSSANSFTLRDRAKLNQQKKLNS
ncbi:MAG: hypothetical protein HYZ44_09325 [Bacteroidetes bacterium]|nr:hypothetical protein [Bacteroidota bacterium]